MNRRRLLIIMMLALVSGLLAGFSALQYLRQRPTPIITAVDSPRRTVDVVVAARDLPLASLVGSEDILTVRWPAESVPPGYAQSPDEVVGRGLLTPVRMHEPLLDSKLGEPGLGGGLPIIIPEGKRALSIRVDEVVAVAGFVVPGTRVDVLLTITAPNENQPQTRTILQNVTALTSGQITQRDEEGNPIVVSVITLLVTPTEAERLTLAANQGRIHLSLRNLLDVEEVPTPGARIAGVLQGGVRTVATGGGGGGTAQAVQPTTTQARRSQIEMLRGGNRSLVTYTDTIRN